MNHRSRSTARPSRAALAASLVLAAALAGPAGAAGPEVIVAPVAEIEISDPIEALGTLKANESANLTATLTETIAEIRFSDGQRVEAGEVLVALTNREQLAELAEAEAEAAEAERQYRRVRDLAERGQESRALLDQRERELDTARARLRAVQARLSDRLITAPFDGVVGLRNVSVGSLLTPGALVTTIHDDSVMKLDFTVPEVFLAHISPGLPVSARSRAFPEVGFTGEVTSLSNQIDPVTRAFEVRAELPNPERRLMPGMLMTVVLESNPRVAAVVPEEALITRGRSHHVFAVVRSAEGSRAVRREVEIGVRRPGQVEITSGVEPGTLVVIHGGFRLADGQEVQIRAIADGEQSLAEILGNRAGS